MSRLALLLVLLPGFAAAQDGESLMRQLEARLINARHIVIEAQVEASGAVSAQLKGRSALLDRNRATWTYAGSYDGGKAELGLTGDGHFLKLRHNQKASEVPAGRESNRALLLGFTRMGLSHNLLRLANLWAPDHGEGGVGQWLTLDAYRPTTFPQGGAFAGTVAFGFDMFVDGRETGSARIWVDPDSGLPKRRQQTLRMPQGVIEVVETYTRFEVQ